MKVGKIFQDLSQNWLKLKIFFIFIFLMGNFGIFCGSNLQFKVACPYQNQTRVTLRVES